LSIGEIVEAAAELAGSGGLDAVTISRVAARQGLATNSLYRYVDSKDELVLLLFDHGIGEPPVFPSATGWRAAARSWMEQLAARYAARPWLLDVRLSGPPMTPNALGWLDALLAGLDGSDWSDDDKLQLATLLDRLAYATASLQIGVLDRSIDRPDPGALVGFLKEQTACHGYTHVGRLLENGALHTGQTTFDLNHALTWLFGSDVHD
jgi:AcrR family transcriptional regulator